MKLIISGALALSVATGAHGQAKPAAPAASVAAISPVCKRLDAAIETALKAAADGLHGGGIDNSAPRESNRLGRSLVHQATIHNTLAQMAMHGCVAPSRTLDPSEYQFAAMNCALSSTRQETLANCNQANWKRNGEDAAARAAQPASAP